MTKDWDCGLRRSALASESEDPAMKQQKDEMVSMYVKVWHFIYSIYHGKCLSWGLSHFFTGGTDACTTSCFATNTPLCAVCAEKETICQESRDIKEYLILLVKMVIELCDNGLDGVTKTLPIAVLLKCNQKYVLSFNELKDFAQHENTMWGCGTNINGIVMSKAAWHKIIYVAVHLGYLDLSFKFRSFKNHYEVHRRYNVTSAGKVFVLKPHSVVSVDPHSSIIDMLLGAVSKIAQPSTHKRGTQLKPHLISAMEGPWTVGNIENLKFLGSSTDSEHDLFIKPIHFDDCFSLFTGMKDPHFLLQYIQFSHSQTTTNEMSFCLGGVEITLLVNRSYCSGVKVCGGGENRQYAVSTKQRLNRCAEHGDMALVPTGPCTCHLAYVYPKNATEDGRRWFVALSNEKKGSFHNHPLPSEWKIPPHLLKDIQQTAMKNVHIAPKDIQKGVGMDCQPMEVSLAAANIDRIRTILKKSKKRS